MDDSLVGLAIGFARLLLYAGFVMVAGTLLFWVRVWPEGPKNSHLRRTAKIGAMLLAALTVLLPVLKWQTTSGADLWDVVSREGGAAALIRLALLALFAASFSDFTRDAVRGRRALMSVGLVVALCGTLVAQSNAIEGSHVLLKAIATMGHLLATAGWLGGLVALATVIIPRENVSELDRLIPSFSKVAFISVIVLVVTGTLHAVTVAGGVGELINSDYGLWLGLKVVVFALMLVMGNHGRKYVQEIVFRRMNAQQVQESSTVQMLAVVMGAELAIAGAVLAMTAALVAVAPSSA